MDLLLITIIVIVVVVSTWLYFYQYAKLTAFVSSNDKISFIKAIYNNNLNQQNNVINQDNIRLDGVNINTDLVSTPVINNDIVPAPAPGSSNSGTPLDQTNLPPNNETPVLDENTSIIVPDSTLPTANGNNLPTIGSNLNDTPELPTSVPLIANNFMSDLITTKQKFEENKKNLVLKDQPVNIVASRRDSNQPNFYQTMTTNKVNGMWLGVLQAGRAAEIPGSHPPRVEKYYLIQN